MLLLDHRQETRAALLEWAPELLLILTDVLILGVGGEMDKVPAVSVAGIMLGALSRLTRTPAGVCKKLAEKHTRLRAELLSLNYAWAALCALLAAALWLISAPLERFVRLPGLADYLLYGAPGVVLLRFSVVAYMALGVNQAHIRGRIILAWALAVSNVVFTALLVPRMGVSGASLGTLLADVVPAAIVTWWAWRARLLVKPRLRLMPAVWHRAKRQVLVQVPALCNSAVAVLLNRWLGQEFALLWSLSHTACDTAGGLASVVWAMGGKHYTYNLSNARLREEAWAWCDRIGVGVTLVGAALSALVTPMAPVIVLAYAVGKRNAYLCEREATKAAFDKSANGRLAWCACCIAGYSCLVLFGEPSVWAATAVYVTAATAMYTAMR